MTRVFDPVLRELRETLLLMGGRAESILMSMPPQAAWRYDWKPAPGSPEEKLYTDFLKPRDWT